MLLVCELSLVTVGVVAERRVHVALKRKATAECGSTVVGRPPTLESGLNVVILLRGIAFDC